jgi:hypothetical protein
LNEEVTIQKEVPIEDDTIEKEMEGVTQILTLSPNVVKTISFPRSSVKVSNPSLIRQFGCVLPPYNPAEILRYKELDITYQTCVEIKADTAISLGYSFSNYVENKKDIKEFFKTPNRNFSDTMAGILRAMYVDLEDFHNGYLEFVRSGNKRSIYYMPAKDVYIRPKMDSKGNMLRDVDKYLFIPSGSITPIELEPYPITKKVRDGVHYMLHFKIHSQNDLYYGSPQNAHLFDLIKLNYLSDQFNINFFSNGGQPAWACLITGGKLSAKAYRKIKEFFETNLKGVANAHKMLFLSVPNEKATIKLIPLSKSIDEQFIHLTDKIQFKIALKCRVHPKLLGLNAGGGLGGGSAGITDLKLFIETVSKAAQSNISMLFNKFLELEFGVYCGFNFNGMNISNDKDDAVIANLYWNMVDKNGNRVLSLNEIRQLFLHLKAIDLKNTPANEEQTEEIGHFEISPTKEGEMRSSDGSDLGLGDGEQPNNLDPNKFDNEKI